MEIIAADKKQFYIGKEKTCKLLLQVIILTVISFLAQLSFILDQVFLLYFSGITFLFMFILSNKENKLLMILFILPSNYHIKFGQTSIITLASFIYFIQYAFVKKEKFRKDFILLGLMLVLYPTIAFIGNISTVIFSIKIFLFSFMVESMFNLNSKDAALAIEKGIIFFIFGVVVSSFITLFLSPTISFIRFSLLGDDAINELAVLCGILIALIFTLFYDVRSSHKTFWLMMLFPLIYIGFLTYSKTFFFLLAISIIWFIISNINKKKTVIKTLNIMFFLGIVFLLLFYLNSNFSSLFLGVIERVIPSSNNDISTGRFDIWRKYLSEMHHNPSIMIFGSGNSVSPSIKMAAHNIFIEQLYLFGITGNLIILLFFLSTINFLKRRLKTNRNLFKYHLPMITLFSALFFLNSFIGGANTVLFFISLIIPWIYPNKKDCYNILE